MLRGPFTQELADEPAHEPVHELAARFSATAPPAPRQAPAVRAG